MSDTKHHNILPLIDSLAAIRAQLAALEARETELKNDLKALGPGTHTTDKNILTITEATRESLDMVAVREKLSDQFIRAHTKTTSYVTLKVTARKHQQAAE
jgi:hypothetical protein